MGTVDVAPTLFGSLDQFEGHRGTGCSRSWILPDLVSGPDGWIRYGLSDIPHRALGAKKDVHHDHE